MWWNIGSGAVSAAPILVSSTALSHLKRLKADKGDEELLLRIGVKSGGCSGMSYAMDFTTSSQVAADDSGAVKKIPCRHYEFMFFVYTIGSAVWVNLHRAGVGGATIAGALPGSHPLLQYLFKHSERVEQAVA